MVQRHELNSSILNTTTVMLKWSIQKVICNNSYAQSKSYTCLKTQTKKDLIVKRNNIDLTTV